MPILRGFFVWIKTSTDYSNYSNYLSYNFYAEKKMETSIRRDTWGSQQYQELEGQNIQSGVDLALMDISTILLINCPANYFSVYLTQLNSKCTRRNMEALARHNCQYNAVQCRRESYSQDYKLMWQEAFNQWQYKPDLLSLREYGFDLCISRTSEALKFPLILE